MKKKIIQKWYRLLTIKDQLLVWFSKAPTESLKTCINEMIYIKEKSKRIIKKKNPFKQNKKQKGKERFNYFYPFLIPTSAMSQFEMTCYFEYPFIVPLYSFFFDYGIVVITLVLILYFVLKFAFSKRKKQNTKSLTRMIATSVHDVYSLIEYELQNIAITQAGFIGMWWLPYLVGVFSYILIANLLGLLPIQFAITSHIVIPFHLAVAFNAYLLIIGPLNLGFTFFKNFIPSGIPFILVPFVSFIEIISYSIRTISLTLRLCANIMAGHVLLTILVGFAVLFFTLELPLISGTNLFITFLVIVLETLISAIQAYVFAVLLAVYVSDSVQAKH